MEKIQAGDNTTPTAVERTPPEVWRMALLIAVESPLRPQSWDDVLDGNIVFSMGCRSYKRFERIEALRTQLRLVCQAWNAILKDVGHHLAFIDHGYLQRAQFWGEASRKIRRIEVLRKCQDHNYSIPARDHAPVVPLEDTQWVESLLVSNECRTDIEYQFIMKVLDNAPRLRALEISPEHSIPRQYFTKILNHQALTRITHLSLTFLDVDHEGQLCLPAVQNFHLTLYDYRANDLLPDWQFLSLRNFQLYREDWTGRVDLLEGLDHFVALHGKTITSLLLKYTAVVSTIDSRPYHSKKDFWRWFPNLRLLGPEMGALSSLTPPPANSKLASLAIPSRGIWRDARTKFPLDIYIGELLEACKILSVTRLVMTDSWDDMITGPMCRTSQTLGWSNQLFEEAAVNGIQIFDIDRIPITDRQGERFLEWLRDPTFSG